METNDRLATLTEVERLRAEVVRLQARVDELETAVAARPPAVGRRGLASLIPLESAHGA